MNKYTIKTILVPTDFSEIADKALTHAIDLAKRTSAKLVLVHVVELSLYTIPAEMMSLGLVTEDLIETSKKNIKNVVDSIIQEHSIEVLSEIYIGNVYDNIIMAADLFNANLIVMGTHGASGIKEWLFGSNAFHVVNNTKIPVLTINLHSEVNTFKKVVFPFNENLLTIKKIEQVVAFAKLFESNVLLMGFSESMLGYSRNETNPSFLSLREKCIEITNHFAAENIDCYSTVRQGNDYAEEIQKYAIEKNADLITIVTSGTHTLDNAFKLKHGKKLVNHSEIPVLSVPIG